MIDTLFYIIFALYAAAVCGLMLYGLNCYVMIFLFRRSRKNAEKEINTLLDHFGDPLLRSDLPRITTQIPVFNELNVIEQIMKAACAMRYPNSRHEIQVLDDSTDETRGKSIFLLMNFEHRDIT